jgi:hypothetical protein
MQEKYLEAYSLVDALELQLDRLRSSMAYTASAPTATTDSSTQ